MAEYKFTFKVKGVEHTVIGGNERLARKALRMKLSCRSRLPVGTKLIDCKTITPQDQSIQKSNTDIVPVESLYQEPNDDCLDMGTDLFEDDERDTKIKDTDTPLVRFTKNTLRSGISITQPYPDTGERKADCLYKQTNDGTEPELDDLDILLETYWPDITLLEYKRLIRTLQTYKQCKSGWDSDSSVVYKVIFIDELFQYLINAGKLGKGEPPKALTKPKQSQPKNKVHF